MKHEMFGFIICSVSLLLIPIGLISTMIFLSRRGKRRNEYRIVFDDVFAGRTWFALQARRADSIFFRGWRDIDVDDDVELLAEIVNKLIAVDNANGIEAKLITDINKFRKVKGESECTDRT